MNITYIVNEEGKITVVTDKGETITKNISYSQNTSEILSLENIAEITRTNINVIETKFNQLNKLVRKQKNTTKIINPILFVLLSLFTIMCSTISTKFFVIAGLVSVSATILIGIIEKQIVKKNTLKKDECQKQLKLEETKLIEINNKIESLSKDVTKPQNETINQFIQITTPCYQKTENTNASKYKVKRKTKQSNFKKN